MSYANFKKTIWSKYIQTELPKFTVFKNDCDFTFEGEAKKGERVKILGIAAPTIGTYTPGVSIGNPETPADSSAYLTIDQYKFFNYAIEDIDKAQTNGIMPALSSEATRALAEVEDSFCAEQIAKGAGYKKASSSVTSEAAAVAVIDALFVKLWEKGVSAKDKVTIYVTPWFYNLFKGKLISLHTDNDKIITTGLVGAYNNANVKISNNIYNDGTDDHIIVKTSKGFAFANGINEVEAYRPDGLFCDAIKGLDTFGGKAVRPEQIAVAKVHNS